MDLFHPDILTLLSQIIPRDYVTLCMTNKAARTHLLHARSLIVARVPKIVGASCSLTSIEVLGPCSKLQIASMPSLRTLILTTSRGLSNNDLFLLPRTLLEFSAPKNISISNTAGLPRSLKSLDIRLAIIHQNGLPPSLTHLRATLVHRLNMSLMPRGLRCLDITLLWHANARILDIGKTPETLTELRVPGMMLTSDCVEQLPQTLTTLVAKFDLTRPTMIPSSLRHLDNDLRNDDGVEMYVINTHMLETYNVSLDLSSAPSHLKSLCLTTLSVEDDLGRFTSLRSLQVRKLRGQLNVLMRQLPHITSLDVPLMESSQLEMFTDYPPGLVSLRLDYTSHIDAAILPRTLKTLLVRSCIITNIDRIPNITALSFAAQFRLRV